MGPGVPDSLKPDVVRFLQANLPEWLKIDRQIRVGGRARDGMVSARDASRQLKVSDPTVGQLLNEGKGGMKLLRAVARFRYGGKEDITRLEEEARVWAEENPIPGTSYSIPDGLERVLALAERLDRSVADARRVAIGLAAFTGEVTEEEIVRRFEALDSDGSDGGTTATIGDDITGGASDLKHRRKRKR